MSESRRSKLQMAAAGIAGAVFSLGAVYWLDSAQAQIQGGALPVTDTTASIPAIEIREGSIALVRGPNNQYFVVDRQGNGYPVRFRDQDLLVPVGSTLLTTP
ncbi:MAG: hypothetical protein ACIAQF_07145 [Phycisphaerales bacterium JB065]